MPICLWILHESSLGDMLCHACSKTFWEDKNKKKRLGTLLQFVYKSDFNSPLWTKRTRVHFSLFMDQRWKRQKLDLSFKIMIFSFFFTDMSPKTFLPVARKIACSTLVFYRLYVYLILMGCHLVSSGESFITIIAWKIFRGMDILMMAD